MLFLSLEIIVSQALGYSYVNRRCVLIGHEVTLISLLIPKESIIIGRIFEILVPDSPSSGGAVVTVDIFELGNTLHPDFDMPVLWRTSDRHRYSTVNSKVQNMYSFV
jgi:hypothetical protein